MALRRTLILVALACGSAVGAAACGGPDEGDVVSYIPWSLTAVSADARTLSITHEVPHCETYPGPVRVRETAGAVEVAVPELSEGGDGEFTCTADLQIGTDEIRLAQPLGSRELRGRSRGGKLQPARRGQVSRLRPDECTPFLAYSEDAPARDVPWVAARVAACTAPVPQRLLRLPILQRDRTRGDRLPLALHQIVDQGGVILRPQAARRIRPGTSVWLIPGPRYTCVGRVTRDGVARLNDCQSTNTVAGRGLFTTATCSNRTPAAITLVGVVPSGTATVRLRPKRGSARTVRVRADGTWTARAPYPLEVAWGETRVRTTYDMRACWS